MFVNVTFVRLTKGMRHHRFGGISIYCGIGISHISKVAGITQKTSNLFKIEFCFKIGRNTQVDLF